jgi:PPM family protein phosphatase
MQRLSHAESHCGPVRARNEDAVWHDDARGLYAVADGVGGLPDGALASRRAVECLHAWCDAHPTLPFDFEAAFQGVNDTLVAEGRARHPGLGMGTTLTVASLDAGRLHLAHVGDSAAYLLRRAKLHRLTQEHTRAADLRRQSGRRLPHLPSDYDHVLTRCVGQDSPLQVDILDLDLEPGDRLLLCTDGLSKVIGEGDFQECLLRPRTPRGSVVELVNLALERGGPDNITLVAIFMGQ